MKLFMDPKENLFHVHTFRCLHASMCEDSVYVERALELNAGSIWFTDHAPFPGDPFGHRMRYEELEEYLTTLTELKERYQDRIDIHIGLETEYFPSFDKSGYYRRLRSDERLELLLLGQHMAEDENGDYTFHWDGELLQEGEAKAIGTAICQGIRSGYFDIVAHPDRSFRRRKQWTDDMTEIAEQIINTAKQKGVVLELNETSKRHKHQYWKEFWELNADQCPVVIGLDAHSPEELMLEQ
ncbi:MAG: PHP domain-containing protein [Lachnospiraceae bacterium]|nr:PHP domain-containing protein [Lachnospiraceae bacterium]